MESVRPAQRQELRGFMNGLAMSTLLGAPRSCMRHYDRCASALGEDRLVDVVRGYVEAHQGEFVRGYGAAPAIFDALDHHCEATR